MSIFDQGKVCVYTHTARPDNYSARLGHISLKSVIKRPNPAIYALTRPKGARPGYYTAITGHYMARPDLIRLDLTYTARPGHIRLDQAIYG